MAWRCSGSTNKALVANMKSFDIIRTSHVFETMSIVDRGNYAPIKPYDDSPQYIGYDATISAPHMHAAALECLSSQLQENAKILDVGCGSGYLSVLFARMNPTASVLGIDYISELVSLSEANTMKEDADLLLAGRLLYLQSSGWDLEGVTSLSETLASQFLPPYDAIHVGAAASEIPHILLTALKPGGRMIIPVGPEGGNQELLQIDRREVCETTEAALSADTRELRTRSDQEEFSVTSLMGVRYVPLVNKGKEL